MKQLRILFITLLLFSCGYGKSTIIYNTGTKDYTAIFKEAISTSDHILIKPGYYHLRNTLYLQDNVVIEGEGEVILIKDALYSHVFANHNIRKDNTDDWNKSITIRNIIIDVNSKGTQWNSAHTTANGHLSFKFLDSLKLLKVRIINGDRHLYGVHLQSVTNVLVKDYSYDGNKDAFHINGGCEDILIDGFNISSFDDAFGIMTDDYPRVQHNTKDIRNILIKNGTSRKRTPQSGYFLRLMTGSWEDWKKGNKYKIGHTVNSNNHQYKKVCKDELVSLKQPNHLGGDSLYPDGITWRYIGNGANKTSNIYNIAIFNVDIDDGRKFCRTVNTDRYDYGEYPGTQNSSIVDGLYIDGYPFHIARGKVGIYKLNKKRDYFKEVSDVFLTISPFFVIILSTIYLRNRKKLNSKTKEFL